MNSGGEGNAVDALEGADRSSGLIVVGTLVTLLGVGLGLWAVTIAYDVLYRLSHVPLVKSVLEVAAAPGPLVSARKSANGDYTVESPVARYILLLLLAIFLFRSIGSIVKGFLETGSQMIGLGIRPTPRPRPNEGGPGSR